VTAPGRRLAPVLDGVPVPGHFHWPLLGAVAGDRLHLVGGTPGPEATHLALDDQGGLAIVEHALNLPGAHAVAGSPDGLLLVCPVQDGSSRAGRLAQVDGSGDVRRRARLPLPGELVQWPRITWAGDLAVLVWGVGEELRSATWAGDAVSSVRVLDAGGQAGLDVAGSAAGVLVAAIDGQGSARLLAVQDGAVVATHRLVSDAPVSVARAYTVGDGWAVCWVSGDRSARVQRFDAALEPVGPPVTLPAPAPHERFGDVRLVVGPPDRIVSWTQYGSTRQGPTNPAADSPVQQVQLRDALSLMGADEEPFLLSQPGVASRAAGWIGEHLVVAHGAQAPVVTVLAAVPPGRPQDS
jgi:hypothetical protein